MDCVNAALVREFATSSDPVSVSWARLGVVADASAVGVARGARGGHVAWPKADCNAMPRRGRRGAVVWPGLQVRKPLTSYYSHEGRSRRRGICCAKGKAIFGSPERKLSLKKRPRVDLGPCDQSPHSCAADPSVRSRAPLSHSLSPSRVSSLLSLWSPVRCGGLKRLNH